MREIHIIAVMIMVAAVFVFANGFFMGRTVQLTEDLKACPDIAIPEILRGGL